MEGAPPGHWPSAPAEGNILHSKLFFADSIVADNVSQCVLRDKPDLSLNGEIAELWPRAQCRRERKRCMPVRSTHSTFATTGSVFARCRLCEVQYESDNTSVSCTLFFPGSEQIHDVKRPRRISFESTFLCANPRSCRVSLKSTGTSHSTHQPLPSLAKSTENLLPYSTSDCADAEEFLTPSGPHRHVGHQEGHPDCGTFAIEAMREVPARKCSVKRMKEWSSRAIDAVSPVSDRETGSITDATQRISPEQLPDVRHLCLDTDALVFKTELRNEYLPPSSLLRSLSAEELARLGRAFRNRFPPPPSSLNALSSLEHSSRTSIDMNDNQQEQWWYEKLKPISDQWYALWHDFMVFARRQVELLGRDRKVTFVRAQRWVHKFSRRYRSRAHCQHRAANRKRPSSRSRPRNYASKWTSISDEEREEQAEERQSLSFTTDQHQFRIGVPRRSHIDDLVPYERHSAPLLHLLQTLEPVSWWTRDRFTAGQLVWVRHLPGQGERLWPGMVATHAANLCSVNELLHFATLDEYVLVVLGEHAPKEGEHIRQYVWTDWRSLIRMTELDGDALCQAQLQCRRAGSRQRAKLEAALTDVYELAARVA